MDTIEKRRPDQVGTTADIPTGEGLDISELFPVVHIPETTLRRYRKLPVTGLAALGAAFAQLPAAARTVVQTTTTQAATNETLFVAINPKGVPGFLIEDQFGTVGNIMQINEQGRQVIAGRMRFKAVDALPVNETVKTVIPFDPVTIVVAVAIMAIDQKLNKIQASVEDVLRFLELDKQAKQRGDLRTLAEIVEDYKDKCDDRAFCANRNTTAQAIRADAMRDIEFYQERVGMALQKQKSIHHYRDAAALLDSVVREFAEYQLACYRYAYASFLDVILRRDLSAVTLDRTTEKLNRVSTRYDALYAECRSQIAQYQRGAIESKVVGGLGTAAKGLGRAIGSIPVIKEGPVDEALIGAGRSLGKKNRKSVESRMEGLTAFQDNKMSAFLESLATLHLLYDTKDSMLTDGEALYVLSEA